MDCRGSAVTTISRKTHLEMKELVHKATRKERRLSGIRFCIKASEYGSSQDTRDQAERIENHMEALDGERQNAFMIEYGDIALLLPIKVNEQLLEAIILFWDLSYRCFTFNQEDLTPTMEKYAALLRISPRNPNKVFWKEGKKVPFKKKLA